LSQTETPRVWDLPTRLFHWLVVLLVVVSWWSAENHEMEWHYRSGIALLALVVFRLVWGLIGGSTARFGQFVRSPGAVIAYLKSGLGSHRAAGHNPLGGYSVIAILLAMATQIGTGLFATDIDGLESGPLSYMVTFDQGRAASEVHEIAFNALLALVVIHVVAIVVYTLRGRRLLPPMVTGRDPQLPADATGLVPAGPVRFVLAAAIALGMAWFVSNGLSFSAPM
jgi:cytochrome b